MKQTLSKCCRDFQPCSFRAETIFESSRFVYSFVPGYRPSTGKRAETLDRLAAFMVENDCCVFLARA